MSDEDSSLARPKGTGSGMEGKSEEEWCRNPKIIKEMEKKKGEQKFVFDHESDKFNKVGQDYEGEDTNTTLPIEHDEVQSSHCDTDYVASFQDNRPKIITIF